MALIGNLKELKLPNLIQLNCLEKNTAKLTINSSNRFGVIYFENGEIVHAEFDPFIGEKAIYAMLELKDGQFKVENDIKAPTVSIRNAWSNILLEGLRLLDEKNAKDVDINLNDIVDLLTGVKSVSNAAILNIKTQELFGKKFIDEMDSYLFFMWQKSKKVLNLFYSDKMTYTFIKTSKQSYLLIEKLPYLVFLELNTTTLIDDHLQTIMKIISF